MFIRVFLTFLLMLSFVDARTTTEIREGTGVPTVNVHDVYGTYKSRDQSRFPYVCYDKRVIVYDDYGRISYKRYDGCKRTDGPCRRFGKEHFGKYPNDYEAYKAMRRCVRSNPRFVD